MVGFFFFFPAWLAPLLQAGSRARELILALVAQALLKASTCICADPSWLFLPLGCQEKASSAPGRAFDWGRWSGVEQRLVPPRGFPPFAISPRSSNPIDFFSPSPLAAILSKVLPVPTGRCWVALSACSVGYFGARLLTPSRVAYGWGRKPFR